MGVRIHIYRRGDCLLSYYLMSMQHALAQLSIHTDEIENRNATWSNHWPVGGKYGRGSYCMFIER